MVNGKNVQQITNELVIFKRCREVLNKKTIQEKANNKTNF